MPRYDVLLIPCVAVKVPQIDAPTMADAVKKAKEIAELQRLFAPVNCALPSGVSWVEWTNCLRMRKPMSRSILNS